MVVRYSLMGFIEAQRNTKLISWSGRNEICFNLGVGWVGYWKHWNSKKGIGLRGGVVLVAVGELGLEW